MQDVTGTKFCGVAKNATISAVIFCRFKLCRPYFFPVENNHGPKWGTPISLATSPTPKTAFLVSSWTILSWSVCLSQDDFFWSDPEFRQAMFDDF
jgi:hypothetical protein